MSNPLASLRSLLIYAICVPLALLLGYLLAGPMDYSSYLVFVAVLSVLILPLAFKWYHLWLILSWNLCFTLYGIPGSPPAWLLMAFLSFFIALGHHILNRDRKYLHAPGVTWSLLFLGFVVVATMQLSSGFGLRIFGSGAYGGKRYLNIFLAIMGYFAFISQPVPPERRKLYAILFILSGATQAIGELVNVVPEWLYPIFLFFPANYQGYISLLTDDIPRFGGLATACSWIIYALLARYGVAETLTLRKLWRPVLFFTCLLLIPLGGFRSFLMWVSLTFVLVLWLEGLLWSRWTFGMLAVLAVVGVVCIAEADRLPMNVQRTLSFLPLNISTAARESANSSSEWRYQMWRNALPQIPKYLLIGKGLTYSGEEQAEIEAIKGGINPTAAVELAGDYHNGPLSLIIPFGIFGVIGFLWFLVASIRVLRANYLYGDPECRTINRFLLAYFVVRIISYVFIFGSFYGDLAQFVGFVGFSISLNAGVARKPMPTNQAQPIQNRTRFPLFQKPAGAESFKG